MKGLIGTEFGRRTVGSPRIHPRVIDNPNPPILDHPLAEPSEFAPDQLMDDVRLPAENVPPVCILEFDGDITDRLVRDGTAQLFEPWACFHTSMFAIELEGVQCGMISRTIGGPYTVLIAEQLQAAGAKLIIGLTSAGRVSPDLPLPSLVVVTSAIRDEGTSYHYLAPAKEVGCNSPVTVHLATELSNIGWAIRSGKVWTTDAPYRETKVQLERWANDGVLAVEMQAAALFAFGIARQIFVASVAMVSNAVDHTGKQFDTGSHDDCLEILKGIARAARSFLLAPTS